jgi:heme-degrading monooxygenase HmoA
VRWLNSVTPPASATFTRSGRSDTSVGDPAEFSVGQIVTVFRSRLRKGGEAAYGEMAADMENAARATPGFVDFAAFAAADSERVSVVTFANLEAQATWRDDLRHRAAQRMGRNEFYDTYSVQVGECHSVSRWERPQA